MIYLLYRYQSSEMPIFNIYEWRTFMKCPYIIDARHFVLHLAIFTCHTHIRDPFIVHSVLVCIRKIIDLIYIIVVHFVIIFNQVWAMKTYTFLHIQYILTTDTHISFVARRRMNHTGAILLQIGCPFMDAECLNIGESLNASFFVCQKDIFVIMWAENWCYPLYVRQLINSSRISKLQ